MRTPTRSQRPVGKLRSICTRPAVPSRCCLAWARGQASWSGGQRRDGQVEVIRALMVVNASRWGGTG
jgi:hypothetical protein